MLFLDCEFNGHKGHLISLGIAATNGDDLYQVYDDTTECNQWVTENVIPKLEAFAAPQDQNREILHDYLRKHVGETIVADSPADFWYLMDLCHQINKQGKYRYINLNLKMEFVISGDIKSENPHNALADARALMKWYQETLPASSAM